MCFSCGEPKVYTFLQFLWSVKLFNLFPLNYTVDSQFIKKHTFDLRHTFYRFWCIQTMYYHSPLGTVQFREQLVGPPWCPLNWESTVCIQRKYKLLYVRRYVRLTINKRCRHKKKWLANTTIQRKKRMQTDVYLRGVQDHIAVFEDKTGFLIIIISMVSIERTTFSNYNTCGYIRN